MTPRVKAISKLTEELHENVASIYEDLVDEEYTSAEATVEETIERLKHLKINIRKDEI
jgi:hypothetical protein